MKENKRTAPENGKSLKERLTQTKEGQLLWNQEAAILDTTFLICELMKAEGVSRAELARRLGKSKGYVTQLLDGSTNMTIRTVSDVFTHLGYIFKPSCVAHDDAAKFSLMIQSEFQVSIPYEAQDKQTPTLISYKANGGSVNSLCILEADSAKAQLTA